MYKSILFLVQQKLSDLPGIGNAHRKKFNSYNIETCQELQGWSLRHIQQEFGPKLGETLHKFCRGLDDRPLKLENDRKSVSAEINYGIRFEKVCYYLQHVCSMEYFSNF